ncbi:MAG: glutathione-disulfide reductase [Myxococcota bacterium]
MKCNPAETFDLLVIGGGSGGLAHAQRAAEYGVKVAIVEGAPLGGTCVNLGCVPKKVMWYAASHAVHARRATDYGFSVGMGEHDWGELKRRRDAYIKRLNGIYENNLARKGVTLLRGYARLLDERTVAVGDERFTANAIAIATGGKPLVPAVPGAEHGITSDGFFALSSRPRRVAIVGAGYIAVEVAGVFHALGTETTLIARREGVLREFDAMLGTELVAAMTREGISLETGAVPKAVVLDGEERYLVTDDGRQLGPFDGLLWAVGRVPNTKNLGLENAGVVLDEDGYIPVNDFQETNVEHIYAIGDVTGRQALTPVAIAAGRRLADRLYGGMEGRHLDYENIATVIFSHPPIGTVGLSEAAARERYGDAVRVFTSRFNPMVYALSEHRVPSSMKLVTVGEDEKVIGIHVIGDGADEMTQGFAVALRMGATKRDLDDTVAIHPTSAEELVTMR